MTVTDMLFAVTPTPTPSPSNSLGYSGDVDAVTPGWIGFTVTFALAVAVVLLLIDMVRRVRRVRYREEIRQRLEQERADAAGEDPVDQA